jgi:parallel beta-helix repeat protein
MLTVHYAYADGRTFSASILETASAASQTAAIQKALTAVATNGGGEVHLSAGTWTVAGTGKASDGCLKIGSNTTLEGAGLGATVLKLADGSSAVTGIIRTESGKTKADGSYTTVENVTIKNLSLDGNAAHTTGDVDGFYTGPKPGTAQADTNITLDAVEIKNCSRYGFDPHEQTVGLTIRNSSAHHNGVDGFTIDFCSQVLLENNTAFANGRHGFNIVTGSHDVTLLGNNAHDNGGSGISVQTGDNEVRGWTDAVTISGGVLADNGRSGIEIKQASHIFIDHVNLSGNAMAGVSLAGVEHVTLTANLFNGNGDRVQIAAYLQDFNDADALNDRWIATRDVRIDGVLQVDAAAPAGASVWDYRITDGDDVITTSSGNDIVAAGSGNDQVQAGAGHDSVYGNDGHDSLDGGTGNDSLYGGAGNDRLYYVSGVDRLDGGSGSDAVDFSKALSAVTVDLTSTTYDVRQGGLAVAALTSIENVRGSSFADTITGDSIANFIDGAGGNDLIFASAGTDTVIGNGGNDRLTGGVGNDSLSGGSGSDIFYFDLRSGSDTIADFTRKQDKIDITGITNISQLAITQVGSATDISFGASHVLLSGVVASTLTASDFILH